MKEKRIKKVIDTKPKKGGCLKCQSSCQTACKTSATVSNQGCANNGQ